MITFRWFSKLWEFAIGPVIITTINDNTTNAGTMTTDPFRCRLNYNIGALFNWFEIITTSAKSIVNDQWQIIFFCQRNKLFKVRNIQTWVTNCFKKNRFGVFINMWNETFNIITIGKTHINT